LIVGELGKYDNCWVVTATNFIPLAAPVSSIQESSTDSNNCGLCNYAVRTSEKVTIGHKINYDRTSVVTFKTSVAYMALL